MKTCIALLSLLMAGSSALQLNKILQQNRAELQWRDKVSNKFTWDATQKLEWTVVNAFIDVQTSPTGDVYAIQKIGGDLTDPKYYVYIYSPADNTWNLMNKTFQAKAVRFDLLGNRYFLDPNNCVLNDQNIQLTCNVKDFEVTADKKIYAINLFANNTVEHCFQRYWKWIFSQKLCQFNCRPHSHQRSTNFH